MARILGESKKKVTEGGIRLVTAVPAFALKAGYRESLARVWRLSEDLTQADSMV